MSSLTGPGVYINEATFPAFAQSAPGAARAAFIGPHPRGPLIPTVVNSWSEFTAKYGGFNVVYPPSALALQVYQYFSSGGTSAVVIRVVASASGPTTASVTLSDQAGTPLPTLRVVSKNPGLWGTGLYVDVVPGNQTVGGVIQTFSLVVKLGGNASSNIVEVWENLSMIPVALGPSTIPGSGGYGVDNYAPDVVNSLQTGSNLITVVDLLSVTAGVLKNPLNTATSQQLTGGTDGNAPAFTDTNLALTLLNQFPDQSFLINLPGGADITDIGNALTFCEGRGDCFLIADCPQGLTPAAAAAFAGSLSASSFGALYYPYLVIADPYATQAGRTRTIAPGGSVMGAIISNDINRTVSKAPAGLQTNLPNVISTDTQLAKSDIALLTQGNVNPIIPVVGAGIVIYGARTLSNVLATRYINVRRTLIYLRVTFISLTKFAIFENNDWVLWNSLTAVLSQFLLQFWQSGGLQGQSSAQAFYVVCDPTNNSPASISAGIVNITVGVALQRPAEFIVIQIGQSAATATTTTTTSVG